MALTITRAQKPDMEAMCELLQELFSLEDDFEPHWEKQRRGLEYIIDHPEYGLLMLLKDNTDLIVMVNLLFTVSTALGSPVILLEDLIIKVERRRQGLGKYMMNQIKAYAQAEGYARITLLVDKDNTSAQKFYLEEGFAPSNMDCWRFLT